MSDPNTTTMIAGGCITFGILSIAWGIYSLGRLAEQNSWTAAADSPTCHRVIRDWLRPDDFYRITKVTR